MSDRPRRKIEMVLKIGADSYEDLAGALDLLSIEAEGSARKARGGKAAECLSSLSTSGGHSVSWNYSVREDGLPHEEYFEELERYLEQRRAEREATP